MGVGQERLRRAGLIRLPPKPSGSCDPAGQPFDVEAGESAAGERERVHDALVDEDLVAVGCPHDLVDADGRAPVVAALHVLQELAMFREHVAQCQPRCPAQLRGPGTLSSSTLSAPSIPADRAEQLPLRGERRALEGR